ncbi:PQQ-dependent sugar dehydrogenase [Derxia gummosa]|uniref:PQQ-dependent sugar dehydrogenase n=1 Tax=Derxia gummosa DSM 723 TaxID=1121388 RepID=A0A8B6X4H2_9BURK|nr:sorbosone dehydrogenase family protein [Derxia gummosa]
MKFRFALSAAALAACAAVLALPAAHADTAQLPVSAGMGPDPQLPAPDSSLIRTVNVAKAVGWPAGGKPVAAQGLAVGRFADGLDHPRWLHVLPDGAVLVAESNAPPKGEGGGEGLRGWVQKQAMKRAGAGVASPNRIVLLRDADGDGRAEVRQTLVEGINSPFGMALVGDTLYVAAADAVLAFPWRGGAALDPASARKLADLPGGPRNHHWTKSLIASPDGRTLYVGVGSNSNVAENGLDAERDRAAILAIDTASGATRVFASGLRNPVGLAWQPDGGALWVAVNERDELGSDLVPDYMTSVKEGAFYGWPWSYYGQHVDERVKPARPDMVAKAIRPDYALGPHTASLGLAWSGGNTLPPAFARGMFVGQHGSWNRRPPSGYRVIFVPFEGARPTGMPVDVLTGFLNDDGEAQGRPVGVAIGRDGALLVADDVGNTVWRVTAAR